MALHSRRRPLRALGVAVVFVGSLAVGLADGRGDDGPAPPSPVPPAAPPATPPAAPPSTPPVAPPAVAATPLREAARKVRAGDLDGALDILDRAVEASTDLDLQILRVEVLSLKKDNGSRSEVIRRRATERPDDPIAAYLAARLLPQKEATAEFVRLTAKFANSPWSHFGRAWTLEQAGKLKEALKEHDLAVAAAEDSVRFRAARARALEMSERWADAQTDWTAVSIARPDDPAALLGLGESLRRQGDAEGAILQFTAAEKLEPTDPEPQYRIGLARLDGEKFEEALAAFDKALAVQPKAYEVLCAASTASLRKESATAKAAKKPLGVKGIEASLAYADRAIAVNGDLSGGYMNRGFAHEAAGVSAQTAVAPAEAAPTSGAPPAGDAPGAPAPGGPPAAPPAGGPPAGGPPAAPPAGGPPAAPPAGGPPSAPPAGGPPAGGPPGAGGDPAAPAGPKLPETPADFFELAVIDYGAAIQRTPIPGPALVRALVSRAHVYFLLDKFDECTTDALRAADVSPTEEAAWGDAGDALTLGGKLEDAVKRAWKPGLKAIPGSARLHHGYGGTLWRLGRLADGIKEFREAVKVAPSNGRYRLSLGEALYQAHQEKDAQPELLQATGLRDDDRESWACLGHAYVALHKWQEAADAYEKVCVVDPKAVDEHIYLAILYADRLKLKDKAKAHAQTYIDRGGADPLLKVWIDALVTGK